MLSVPHRAIDKKFIASIEGYRGMSNMHRHAHINAQMNKLRCPHKPYPMNRQTHYRTIFFQFIGIIFIDQYFSYQKHRQYI